MRGFFWEWDQWNHQWLPVHYQVAEDYYSNIDRLDIMDAAAKSSVPLLVVHARDDATVPASMALALTKIHPNTESVLLESGDHLLGMSHPFQEKALPRVLERVVQRTLSFLKRQ